MNPVLQLILTSGFLITEEAAIGFLPVVNSLLEGGSIDSALWAGKREANLPKISGGIGMGAVFANSYPTGFSSPAIPENSIAIIPMYGEVTKYAYMCGPRGTKALVNDLQQIDSNPNIISSILDLDSPGGEASYTDIAANYIKNTNKPVIGFVSGMAASAAQWLLSATDYSIVSSKDDILGSIGTMFMFWDMQEYLKKEGKKLQTIYATLSTHKNKDYHDLMNGKFDLFRKNRLDPLNEKFHAAIKENRLGKVDPDDKEVFSGMTFNGEEAVRKGLADKIGSFEDALKLAFEKGLEYKNNYVKQSKTIVYV
jgi:protease IV